MCARWRLWALLFIRNGRQVSIPGRKKAFRLFGSEGAAAALICGTHRGRARDLRPHAAGLRGRPQDGREDPVPPPIRCPCAAASAQPLTVAAGDEARVCNSKPRRAAARRLLGRERGRPLRLLIALIGGRRCRSRCQASPSCANLPKRRCAPSARTTAGR